MALDSNGREIPDYSASDLLGPTKPSTEGMQTAIDALVKQAEAANKQSEKLTDAIKSAIKSVNGLEGKLDKVAKKFLDGMKAAQSMLSKMGGSRGKSSLKDAITKKDLNDAVDKLTKESPGFQKLVDTITAKDCICVRDYTSHKLLRTLRDTMQNVHTAILSLKGVASGSSKSSNSKKPPTTRKNSDLNKIANEAVTTADQANSSKSKTSKSKTSKSKTSKSKTSKKSSRNRIFTELDFHKKYVNTLKKSENELNNFLYLHIKKHQFDKRDNQAGHEKIKILRKSTSLQSSYRKEDKEALKTSLVNISNASDEDRSKAIDDYIDKLKVANKNAIIENNELADSISAISTLADKFGKVFLGLDLASKMDLSKAVTTASKYNQSVNQTAFAQGEFVAETRWALKFNKAVLETGKDIEEVQRNYVKVLRSGVKDQKQAVKLTTQGLNLSTMALTDADETVDVMRKYNVELGISNKDMGRLGREIQFAGKMSGVVGEKLMVAMKNAQGLAKNMRDVGSITVEAIGQMTRMVAEAEKLGVGDEMKGMLDVTSKGMANFSDALAKGDATAQALARSASRAGVLGELKAGTAPNDPEVMKKLMDQMQGEFNNVIGKDFKGFSAQFSQELDGKQIKTIEDLTRSMANMDRGSKEYASALEILQKSDILSRNMFNMGVGQFQQTMKAWQESSKTFAERMEILQKKDMSNATQWDKTNHKFEIASLEMAEATKIFDNKSFNKDVKSLGQLLVNQGKYSNLESATKAVSGMSENQKEGLSIEAMASAANKAKEAAIGQGVVPGSLAATISGSDVQKAQFGGEADKQAFVEKVQESMNKSSVELNALQDPVTQTSRTLDRIEATLEAYFGGFMGYLTPFLTPLALLATVVAQGYQAWTALKGIWATAGEAGRIGRASAKSAKETKEKIAAMYTKMAHRGSIYTHDIHITKSQQTSNRLLRTINNSILRSGMGDIGGGIGGGLGGGKRKRRRRGSSGNVGRSVGRASKKKVRSPRKTRRGGNKLSRAGDIAGLAMMGASMFGMDQYVPDQAFMAMDVADMGMEAKDAYSLIKGGSSAAKAGKAVSGASTAAKGVGFMGKASGITKAVGASAGKALPFLSLALGGLTGVMESETAGTGLMKGKGLLGKAESGILGALTGDATTGSSFSGYLGIEQGSASDEALGVLGAAGGGALTGAAIGSVVPVIGTAVGAAVGSIVGAGAELYKVFTKEDSPLRASLVDHFGSLDKILMHMPNPLNGVVSGFSAMGKAATIFGVAEKDVTLGMKASALAAGNATGMLNGLTFGIFKEQLGPEGTWTKGLSKFFNGGLEMINKMWDGAKATFQSGFEFIKAGAKGVWDRAKSVASAGISHVTSGGLAGMAYRAVVSNPQTAAPTPIVPGANPANINSVETKLREERVGSAASPAGNVMAKEMNAVGSNTAEMLAVMQGIAGQMQAFVQLMQQSSPNTQEPTIDSGDPRSNKKPRGTTNYYQWQVSRYSSSPTKGPVQDGQPI